MVEISVCSHDGHIENNWVIEQALNVSNIDDHKSTLVKHLSRFRLKNLCFILIISSAL